VVLLLGVKLLLHVYLVGTAMCRKKIPRPVNFNCEVFRFQAIRVILGLRNLYTQYKSLNCVILFDPLANSSPVSIYHHSFSRL
jgi:hypothetical protein